jgi:hypothetical protein
LKGKILSGLPSVAAGAKPLSACRRRYSFIDSHEIEVRSSNSPLALVAGRAP